MKKTKAIILCGGLGSRLAEETSKIPKPMVEIGGKPILWHIMKIFQFYGVEHFILAAGYKQEVIREYFKNNKEFKKISYYLVFQNAIADFFNSVNYLVPPTSNSNFCQVSGFFNNYFG